MTHAVGEVIAAQSFPLITREMLHAYSKASGDGNRIHLDEEVAKNAGLPGIIAHGMLIAGFMGERARQFNSRAKVNRFKVRFRSMTLLGDTVTVAGTIKALAELKTTIQLEARNQRNEVVAVATVDLHEAKH